MQCLQLSISWILASAERLSIILLIYRFITFLDYEYCSFNKHFHLQKNLSFWLSESELYTSFIFVCDDNYRSDPKFVKRLDLFICLVDKSTGGVSWKNTVLFCHNLASVITIQKE